MLNSVRCIPNVNMHVEYVHFLAVFKGERRGRQSNWVEGRHQLANLRLVACPDSAQLMLVGRRLVDQQAAASPAGQENWKVKAVC